MFFAVYALGFGNHLMMVLLLPAATLFLAVTMPGGLRGRSCGRASSGSPSRIAALGALQYAWNFRSMYTSLVPPASLAEALQTFWFDVTKSDWRSTMIMGVDESALRPRLGMYWFDVTQQFGMAGVVVALVGLACARPPAGGMGLLIVTGVAGVGVLRLHLQRRRCPRLLPAVARVRGAGGGLRGRRSCCGSGARHRVP